MSVADYEEALKSGSGATPIAGLMTDQQAYEAAKSVLASAKTRTGRLR